MIDSLFVSLACNLASHAKAAIHPELYSLPLDLLISATSQGQCHSISECSPLLHIGYLLPLHFPLF